ncbi:MAG: dienelactone hydrolase family protein [Deltaproteobacteria bacterium]
MNSLLVAGEREIAIPIGNRSLPGTLAWPAHPRGLVVFAHGSGSSRLSPRNMAVAEQLRTAGFATLLFDLLTPHEAADRSKVFDIELLGERLGLATAWLRGQPDVGGLPLGYFGASTGAAAALVAAADPALGIKAVVSRGGRPDLASDALALVRAPTLLIVGGLDDVVISLNQAALARLPCGKRLVIIPGASHLFEEGDTLQQAAAQAAQWFARHLAPSEAVRL